ncbi:MAG: bestrophin family ion channel [Nannocystaceae bacterium]
MVVRDKSTWFGIILTLRGSAFHRIWLRLAVTTLVAFIVTELYLDFDIFHRSLTTTPFTLIGLALGIFLGFRNNTSYDRFWEARKLWGRLVNTSRSLTRQFLTLVGPRPLPDPPDAELAAIRERLVYQLIAYVHALRLRLRDEWRPAELAPLLGDPATLALDAQKNRPIAILQGMGDDVRRLWDRGLVDTFHVPVLEASFTDLADIQGGCERIKSTPIPFSYTILIHRIVALYCISLPFGIVDTCGMFTPYVVAMVAYAFYGLDAVGDEIENPFGHDPNDLPLLALSRMIEIDLRQRLGETDLPQPVAAVDDVLD